eukprot:90797_1
MSTVSGWESQPSCLYKYISNPTQLGFEDFIVAPYCGSKEFQPTSNSIQIFHTKTAQWVDNTSSIKYPKKFKSTHHQICNNDTNNELFMYGQEASSIFFNINEKKWKIKKGQKLKIMPGAQIIYFNGTYHIIGGDYNRKHYTWNRKKNKLIEIYEFKDWSTFGIKGYGLIKLTNESLFLFGGYSSKHLTPSNKIYKFSNNKWQLLNTKMPNGQPVDGFACVHYSNKVLIFGGVSNNNLSDEIWILDLVNMQWGKSKIKCPVKDAFYGIIPNTKHAIHLLSKTSGKHWKISINEIINSGLNIDANVADSGVQKYMDEEKKIDESNINNEIVLKYLDNAIKDVSKVVELLHKSGGVYVGNNEVENRIEILKNKINLMNEMLSVNVMEYEKWNKKEILMYVRQIEGGRFSEYVSNIEKVMDVMNIECGAELPEVSSFMLKKFGIQNDHDRNDLIKCFVALKIGGN